MSDHLYSVSVVLDREYGANLKKLSLLGPILTVDSEINRIFAEKYWREFPEQTHLGGITLFHAAEAISPEVVLIQEMDTIDLHHGEYSADPPYTVIRVIGAKPTPAVRKYFFDFGFDIFEENDEGFISTRPMPSDLNS